MDRVLGGRDGPKPGSPAAAPEEGRLGARPREPSEEPLGAGLHRLGLESERDGLLYVPNGYRPDVAAPLVLMLHGSGGDARGGIDPLLALADEAGVILLAPESRRSTWDVILGGFGPDVAFIDRALQFVFDRYRVDPGRIAVEGFSDGASYALSIGLTNGDLFDSVIAFSPGFVSPGKRLGSPTIFISHGTEDRVLPIDSTARRILPSLQRRYDVHYEEFEGGHVVPAHLADLALKRFTR
jgi:phospholipase/carboxylesterase